DEALRMLKSLGEACVWQHPCDLAIPERPHCSAIFLQQSCSALVIAFPGIVHAMTGTAAKISPRIETPTLAASLTFISLAFTSFTSNKSRVTGNHDGFSDRLGPFSNSLYL